MTGRQSVSSEDRRRAASTSFEGFARTRFGDLVRLGLVLTADRYIAEDLAQATLMKVWQRWNRIIANGADPMPYAQRVLTNLWYSWRRRRSYREALLPSLPDHYPQLTDDYSSVDTQEVLRNWLAGLPPRQRAVVALRLVLELSTHETADVLQCRDGTVKSQLARALKKLAGFNPLGTLGESDGS